MKLLEIEFVINRAFDIKSFLIDEDEEDQILYRIKKIIKGYGFKYVEDDKEIRFYTDGKNADSIIVRLIEYQSTNRDDIEGFISETFKSFGW